jgi:thiamine pyrophosphate-dependent acetolactate synthase large subunit-like protein
VSGTPSVAEVVGQTIAAQGVKHAFGVLGSGNLVVTNALVKAGAEFHHARHEGAATCMADGYARVTGQVGIVSVHQGPGLTNTVTGLTEAAKSRTPLVVLAGDAPGAALSSNFRIDQHDLVESVGAIADRVFGPATAADDAQRAYHRALTERRPVVLMLPIDVQPQEAIQTSPSTAKLAKPTAPAPSRQAIEAAADLLSNAERPAIIAGRGAVLADAGDDLEQLAARIGAILATSAPAKGLFAYNPYAVGISGGFACPLAQELLPQADTVVVVGASINHWTSKHGSMLEGATTVIQIDTDARSIGRNRPATLGIIGDAQIAAAALHDELARRGVGIEGFRTDQLKQELSERSWQTEPYEDGSTAEHIDPRTLTKELNRRLGPDKVVAVDSGHLLGWPSFYLDVPDARSWVFPNGFQSVGLGLGNAIGAAIASPGRTTVAAIGDGGAFMALAELETAARLNLSNLVVLIYDDAAYGAEVHHFAPMGHDVSLVKFKDADLAQMATAAGCQGHTIRTADDLNVVEDWARDRPLVLDAKVNPTIVGEWLEEAFRAG